MLLLSEYYLISLPLTTCFYEYQGHGQGGVYLTLSSRLFLAQT